MTTQNLSTPKVLDHISLDLEKAPYIVFDIETTGGNPEKNAITEISAIRYQNGKVEDQFYSMVNPKRNIPPIVRRITGITNQMVRKAPPIEEVMPKLLQFIKEDILVSHNTVGDLKFLEYFAWKTSRQKVPNLFLCTHLLSEKLLPEAPQKSLAGLSEFLKIPGGTFHRAKEDSLLTLELFKELLARLEKQSLKTVADGLRLQEYLPILIQLGWSISPNKIEALPKATGILKFLDNKNKLLFFTSTKDPQKEMLRLSKLEKLPRQLIRQLVKAHHIEFEPHEHIYAALLWEAENQAKRKLSFPALKWHHYYPSAISIRREKNISLIHLGPITPGAQIILGPVKNRVKAQVTLEEAAQALGGKVNRRGIMIPQDMEEVMVAFLKGNIKTKAKELSRRKLSIPFLINKTFRETLHQTIRATKELLTIEPPKNLCSLLDTSGFLMIPTGREKKTYVYLIENALIKQKLVISQPWQQWLQSSDQQQSLASLKESSKELDLPPLSDKDCLFINPTLWAIFGGDGQPRPRKWTFITETPQ